MKVSGLAAIGLALCFVFSGSAQGAAKGPDAGGYSATDQTVFSYLDISGPGGGSSVLAGTDDGTAYLTLPFSFQFYGTAYSGVCVSSNGALYFTPDAPTCSAITDFANVDLASATTPSDLPAVLPFWTDLSFAVPGAGAVYYQGFGTPGNRRFVIQWANAYAATSTSPVNFQVVLTEGTNSVTFQYQTVNLGSGDPASNGGSATVGIHTTGGLAGGQQLEWSYNVPVLSNGYALVFQTSAAPAAPVLTAPANAATGVASPALLSWNTASGATSYDVRVGTTNPPALVTNTAATSYTTSALTGSATYYWQIVAKNSAGSTPSPIYSFVEAAAASGGGGGGGVPIGGGGGGTPAAVTISWANPAPIVYGTPLSSAQLNANASVAGTYYYTPAAGAVLNAGTQTLTVSFQPVTPGAQMVIASVTITVTPAPQTIVFPAIPNQTTDVTSLTLSASSSSGLPVVFSVVSGPATVSGKTLTLTGTGAVTVEADQPGNSNISVAAPVRQTFQVSLGSVLISSVLNAASYVNAPLAPDAYAVIFGSGFATQSQQAGAPPLPITLGGVSATITDSAGTTLPLLLYYVSFSQINFVVPEGLAAGSATVTITNSAAKTNTYAVSLAAVSPALFTSNASGTGPAAAFFIVVSPGGSSQVVSTAACFGTPLTCNAVPIDLSAPGTQVYLNLYGTGIRGASGLSGVSVTAGNVPLQVTYAGLQPTYPGLDQINALMDPSLSGAGLVNVQVTVDGKAANPVGIAVK
jgi:uncharacterized protein (TIGR03437 family)